MAVSNENILNALRKGGLSCEEWRRVVELYPFCEIFVWHYLRELYRGEDVSFDSELERLAIRLGDRQGFYNFMTQSDVVKSPFEYNVASNDYFATQGIDVSGQTMSLSEMARRLKEARLAAKKSSFCTDGEKKNDIPETARGADSESDRVENVRNEAKKNENSNDRGVGEEKSRQAKDIDNLKLMQSKVTELIMRKNYSEALEILRRENDENSKKNSYFAVQIKYLETIINNR